MTVQTPVYMDHQATTPVDPKVLDAMLPYFREFFGNAASRSHSFGLRAEAAVEVAREQVAQSLGANPKEIYFTSGGTESNNLAILGVARGLREKGTHIITAATEHKAVLDPCAQLEKEGFSVTYLEVDGEGRIDLGSLKAAIGKGTILITLMAANNEVGTIHSLKDIGALAREAEVLFHTDAAQAVGKIPMDVKVQQIDLLSLSAHKIYGPKGIGALYVKQRMPPIPLQPLLYGGGHEGGVRSGTLNVPGIVGLGAALKIAQEAMAEESARLTVLADRLWKKLQAKLEGLRLNGPRESRLPGNLNISFAGITSDRFMMELKDVALSSGSACTTADPKPSHVLKALGLSEEESKGSVRIGLGRETTEAEVDYVADRVTQVVEKIRQSGPP